MRKWIVFSKTLVVIISLIYKVALKSLYIIIWLKGLNILPSATGLIITVKLLILTLQLLLGMNLNV